MLSLEEAQTRVLALAPEMPVELVPVEDAVGRYLASDLHALRTQPPAEHSAMDGYAIGGGDQGPWRMVGESRAGHPFTNALSAGEAIRISTGAHLPAGADRVLIQENARVEAGMLHCEEDFPEHMQHVRRRGFDFSQGDVLCSQGTQIGAAQIALALGGGHASLDVLRAPHVAVLDSGDELAADPTQCADNQIPASNGAMLGTMLAELGCQVTRIGPVPDDLPALADALKHAEQADIVITSGGASVGDHDLIQPALEAWGAQLDFWKVAIKPGKPLLVARRGRQAVFGLPGNPVSSFVTCYLFVMPLIRATMGSSNPLPKPAMFRVGQSLPPVGSRREFLRAYWDGLEVNITDSQDSSALAALAAANCLIDRPADSHGIEAGTSVPCYLLKNG